MPDHPLSIVSSGLHRAEQPVTIVRAVQTCITCPSQWDAWDADGRYFYLRHRNGRGSVDTFPSQDVATWGSEQLGEIANFRGELDGEDRAELESFCEQAGITLAPDARLTSYEDYVREVRR